MPNLNKVMLMGNLTRDPELRYTSSNMAVANLGLAVNRRWTNKQTNQQQEETTFVDCEAWGRQAEVLNQYLRKGRPVYLEGRLKLDQWQDQSGNNRSKLKIVIENFQFIDNQGGGGQGGGGGGGYQGNDSYSGGRSGGNQGGGRQSSGASGGSGGGPPSPAHEPIPDDDIPF
ncbi:MAG: single-stranded DNA-binding protein [Planctomycetota bacterium]